MGQERAEEASKRALEAAAAAIAVAGFCGALDPELEPGDLVLATEIRSPEGVVELPSAGLLAGVLAREGLRVRTGPIWSSPHLVHGAEREELRATGAIAVDMESAWLAAAANDRPLAVLRSVVDTPTRELSDALATVRGGVRAYRSLVRASRALDRWAASIRPRKVVLASPRASCAGVERAIEIVERALEQHGPPVYVRKQIVHNAHVVADLERRGAVFVDELDEVPQGSTVVFSAHGVSPAVRAHASARGMHVIDATCPLVAKVHAEARRFAERGYTIVLVGHEGHEEVEGTHGEAPDSIEIVEDAADVEGLEVEDPDRVAYLTQTTLAVDETNRVVERLRTRFPKLVGPRSDDICYATQNRQDAVKALAQECDLILVIGSANSSNSNRLVEVAERAGCPARLIDDERDIDPEWLARAETVGLTAGASAPERLVQRVLGALSGLGPVEVEERNVREESIRFKLPPESGKRG
ncbi:MAG: 4-hydroxy-3-methylbut-2-enyl diphosphate reductase [Thermoleophilaceae bacterium]|nr:4-hydroxy-3-methylbut-2-enyl diphosphate reductase [Thermoleophilaceae bacterium]